MSNWFSDQVHPFGRARHLSGSRIHFWGPDWDRPKRMWGDSLRLCLLIWQGKSYLPQHLTVSFLKTAYNITFGQVYFIFPHLFKGLFNLKPFATCIIFLERLCLMVTLLLSAFVYVSTDKKYIKSQLISILGSSHRWVRSPHPLGAPPWGRGPRLQGVPQKRRQRGQQTGQLDPRPFLQLTRRPTEVNSRVSFKFDLVSCHLQQVQQQQQPRYSGKDTFFSNR